MVDHAAGTATEDPATKDPVNGRALADARSPDDGPAHETLRYEPTEIEPRWQHKWLTEGTYEVDNDDPRDRYYVLCMYPYPSGAAHQGHVRNYTFGDLLTRYRTMQGDAVLSPIGFDSFGLPAENAAIKTGIHPRIHTEEKIEELTSSLERIGASYDWRRVVRSHDPSYIRWSQWIFLQFYEAGLVYRADSPVNWCPGCQTVLANEQVHADGTCDRSGDLVERRNMEQWFYKITDYAQELLDDLDGLDWPEKVKTMQRNWIGRSEGAQFGLPVADADGTPRTDIDPVQVYTTRPDTSFGMTFAVMSPEHPMVDALTTDEHRAAVNEFKEEVSRKSEIDRLSTEGQIDKRGVFTGTNLINPFTGTTIPLYLADYVLTTYGTGAIMAVPGQDQRDWDFATAYELDIIRTVQPPDDFDGEAYTGDGPAINSEWLNGLGVAEAKAKAIEWLEAEKIGEGRINYRLRDWLLSRQRFWGCPIPILYCGSCGEVPVPADDLPVLAPDDVEFMPTGQSPLTYHEGFLNTTCPRCGGPACRETDTMDTFVDSSWYFLRFADPWNETAPFDSDAVESWLPVDQYIGGIEHAILHLMYARFFTKALADLGVAPKELREPFKRLFTQGMVRKDAAKMSKSKGNVVAPEEIIDTQGADTLRLAHLQVKPPAEDVDWEDMGLEGCSRFLNRVWRLARTDTDLLPSVRSGPLTEADAEVDAETHRFIARTTEAYDRWSYNTAVAGFMELTNALYRYVQSDDGPHGDVIAFAIDSLLLVMAPAVPHITAELWANRHGGEHIHAEPWPVPDEAKLAVETVTMIVQVNGKVRDRIDVPAEITAAEAEATALASDRVESHLDGAAPKKVIVRPPNLVNVVV